MKSKPQNPWSDDWWRNDEDKLAQMLRELDNVELPKDEKYWMDRQEKIMGKINKMGPAKRGKKKRRLLQNIVYRLPSFLLWIIVIISYGL